ncbi:MAG: hypothetical protein QNJ55_10935, partial [Xenococcus sp. MO_188.B8]|nr:hypothetical protein [Xenococcus sp. MO_188.B8]
MTATSFPKNPYIIGRPIHDSDNFYGREEIFQFIEDNLLNEVQVILLFGQRRIGKSSIINQIPLAVKLENFVFIPLSLQGKSHKSLGQVLFELATDIRDSINDYLEASEVDITIPKVENFKQNHKIFVEQFLVQIYDILEARNLVLLIDEFDVLEDTKKDSAINQFFPYLYSILPETKQLFLIPVVGRKLDDIPSLISLFKEAPYKQIGILDKYYAKQLICQPTKGILNFDANSIQAILDLSGGHPYFIQLICFTLFGRLRQEQKYHVSREDVTEIVDKAIEHGEGGLAWFYAGLTIPEKLIFSVVAELQEHKNTDLWQFLKQQKISKKESLVNAYDRLSSWGFIQQEWKQIPNPIQIEKITVELVRHWLLRRHPAEQEIRTYKELLRAYTTKIMRRYLPSSVAALTLIIGGFGWWYSPWGQIQRVRWELTALSNRTSNDYRQKAALAFSKDGSLQRAIASAESIIDSFTKTKTLITISENFRILENFSDAEKSLERAIAVAQQIPRSSDKVRALTAISEIYVTLESFPKAEKSLELAIAAAESITDSRLKAEVLIAITETYGKLENFPQVAQSLELAIAAAQEISDSLFKAEVMTEIAETISKIENFSEAAQSLELARTTAVSITDSLDKAWVLISIAEAYSQLKNPAAASEVLKSALEVTMQINNSRSQFFALIAIAEAIGQLNQPQQASQVLEQAITAANQFDNLSAKADALIVIAETAGQIENFPKAANSLELALATADSITDSYNKARVLTTIAETAGQIENFPKAANSLELALATADSITDSYNKARVLTTI